jgi:L-threonylcarbamoyladenylate synthase
METKILKLNEDSLKIAGDLIRQGENVAFPTETVYGLGANVFDSNAVKNIFIRKGRAQDNPLIVHFAHKKDILKVAKINNDIERTLIKKCMPGPISIVLEKASDKIDVATCGMPTVACRIPSNRTCRKFIDACGCPICAPSANTSKRPSPTTAKDVYEDMNGKIPLIIDGGRCRIGVESTVVRVINNEILILRPGRYSQEKLAEITGVNVRNNVDNTLAIASPGTRYAHYMPICYMEMIKNDIVNNAKKEYTKFLSEGKKPIIFCAKDNQKLYKNMNTTILGHDSNSACYNLFEKLRKYEKKYDVIIAEFVSGGDMETAEYNRMSKSSSQHII